MIECESTEAPKEFINKKYKCGAKDCKVRESRQCEVFNFVNA